MAFSIQSDFTKQTLSVVTNIMNKEISNINIDSVSKTTTDVVSSLETGGPACGATVINAIGTDGFSATGTTINAGENIISNVTFNSTNITSIQTQMDNAIKNALNQYVKQTATTKGSWLNIGFSLSVNMTTTINEETVTNNINNITQTDYNSQCSDIINNYINKKALLCGSFTDDTINLGLDVTTTGLTICANKVLLNFIATNNVLNQFSQNTDQATKDITPPPLAGLTNIARAIIIAVAAIVGIIIIGVIILVIYLFVEG